MLNIYIYICVCVCVCLSVCLPVFISPVTDELTFARKSINLITEPYATHIEDNNTNHNNTVGLCCFAL